MKYWLDSKQFTPATMLSSDQLHMTDASYHCLAQLMADVIVPIAISAANPAAQPSANQAIKLLSGPECRPQRREAQVKNGSDKPPAGHGGGQC